MKSIEPISWAPLKAFGTGYISTSLAVTPLSHSIRTVKEVRTRIFFIFLSLSSLYCPDQCTYFESKQRTWCVWPAAVYALSATLYVLKVLPEGRHVLDGTKESWMSSSLVVIHIFYLNSKSSALLSFFSTLLIANMSLSVWTKIAATLSHPVQPHANGMLPDKVILCVFLTKLSSFCSISVRLRGISTYQTFYLRAPFKLQAETIPRWVLSMNHGQSGTLLAWILHSYLASSWNHSY